MLIRTFLMLLIASLTAACQSTAAPIDTACMWVKPITTNKTDRALMARQVKEQIAAHNDLYDLHCPGQ